MAPAATPKSCLVTKHDHGVAVSHVAGHQDQPAPMSRTRTVVPGGKWEVAVRWPAADASRNMSGEEFKALFDKIAPEYRHRSDRFLRPALDADGSTPPSPLMTWWLLLYSSILARYEPRRWAKLLDFDKTET